MAALRNFVLGLALLNVCATGSAQVSYSLRTPPPGFYALDVTLPTPVISDSHYSASSLTDCVSRGIPCTAINFYVDAYAARLTGQDMGWQAISLVTPFAVDYFYFAESAFTTPGVYDELGRSSVNYFLTVSVVPEPATWVLMLAGLVVAGYRAQHAADRRWAAPLQS